MRRYTTYTTVDVARLLGIGRDTIYRWIRAGKIKGPRFVRSGNLQIRAWTKADVRQIRRYKNKQYMKTRARTKKTAADKAAREPRIHYLDVELSSEQRKHVEIMARQANQSPADFLASLVASEFRRRQL